jgi:hypothetical protein
MALVLTEAGFAGGATGAGVVCPNALFAGRNAQTAASTREHPEGFDQALLGRGRLASMLKILPSL